jgi:hypothetical protein
MKCREVREKCIMRSFAKYNYNDEIQEDEIGGACSTNGGK